MTKPARRAGARLAPALWLTADAGLAALVAWPAEALLLFLLNPDLPFTLGGFGATMIALLPQALAIFVLAGPLAVLFFTTLRVGRNTRRGLSARYVLRFGALDAAFLAFAALRQWQSVGELLPSLARSALGLAGTSLAVSAALAAALAFVDGRRPGFVGVPWILALGVLAVIPLGVAGDMRRVKLPEPRPVEAPGFEPSRRLLIVEIPGLDPDDLAQFVARGNTPALEALAGRGAFFKVAGGPVVDPVALHATLVTGRDPRRHRILAGVRYKPATWDIAFGIFPRGLLLRPLLLTPFWERVPAPEGAVRAVALPGIARALGLEAAVVGDPLGWKGDAEAQMVVPRAALRAGAAVRLPGEDAPFVCPSPAPPAFNPPADSLRSTPALAAELRANLAEDVCALAAGRRLLARSAAPAITLVRLAGYGRTAWRFAGWRDDHPARNATEQEIAAYKWTLTRYVRLLDPEIGQLVDAAGPRALVAVVAPLGVRPRQDVGAVGSALLGATSATGSFAGPPPGFVVVAGEGARAGERLPDIYPLTAVLPTLLWAQGLPAAEDMGPIVRGAFAPAFLEAHPLVALPSYDSQ